MIINLIIYGSVFVFGFNRMLGLIELITGAGSEDISFWLQLLHIILITISIIIILFICYLLFIIFGSLVTAPFNEEISQRVEEIVTKGAVQQKLGFWQDATASIKGETKKIIFYISILFLLFLFGLIPVIGNVISVTLSLIFSFYYNALDFLDYPLTRKLATFREKLKVASGGKMITYGFGTMAFLMMFLPVVNVFMKPVLVAAGTSLYYEKYFKFKNPGS